MYYYMYIMYRYDRVKDRRLLATLGLHHDGPPARDSPAVTLYVQPESYAGSTLGRYLHIVT